MKSFFTGDDWGYWMNTLSAPQVVLRASPADDLVLADRWESSFLLCASSAWRLPFVLRWLSGIYTPNFNFAAAFICEWKTDLMPCTVSCFHLITQVNPTHIGRIKTYFIQLWISFFFFFFFIDLGGWRGSWRTLILNEEKSVSETLCD